MAKFVKTTAGEKLYLKDILREAEAYGLPANLEMLVNERLLEKKIFLIGKPSIRTFKRCLPERCTTFK
ncbi:MAG: hypothetical protein HC880_09945 [Bacteroidia bacterium]|nr:hypothetical protein [Bacteroidia bacterium]